MRRALLAFSVLALSSCGYSLQGTHNPLADSDGVRKIYIAPLVNNSYKIGVEKVIYNALLKTFSVHRKVELVSAPKDADAVLDVTVRAADYSSAGSANVTSGSQDLVTVTLYGARLVCSLTLRRTAPVPPGSKLKPVIWSGEFSRGKPFPSSVQKGVRGQTTSLINESEFDRALGDISTLMAADVHESMLTLF